MRCPNAIVVGIDRDPQAIALATARLAPFGDRFRAHHAEYDDIAGALAVARADAVDGHPARPRREFAPDRRGRPRLLLRARRSARHAHEPCGPHDRGGHLARRGRGANSSASCVCTARSASRRASRAPSFAAATRTPSRAADSSLTWCARASPPPRARRGPTRPSARSRRYASRSTASSTCLERTLPRAIEATAVGGRIVVMSYHSLEDRLVKHAFAAGAENSAPVGLPVVPGGRRAVLAPRDARRGEGVSRRGRGEPPLKAGALARRRAHPCHPSIAEGSMSAAPARHPRPIAPAPRPRVRLVPVTKPAPSSRTQPQRRAPGAPNPGRRDHLRAVAAPEQARSLVPFAWTCALIVVGALSAVLFINTSMAGGAYERRDLKIEIANLHEERTIARDAA